MVVVTDGCAADVEDEAVLGGCRGCLGCAGEERGREERGTRRVAGGIRGERE